MIEDRRKRIRRKRELVRRIGKRQNTEVLMADRKKKGKEGKKTKQNKTR